MIAPIQDARYFKLCTKETLDFQWLGPLGRVSVRVAMSIYVCMYGCVPFPCAFITGGGGVQLVDRPRVEPYKQVGVPNGTQIFCWESQCLLYTEFSQNRPLGPFCLVVPSPSVSISSPLHSLFFEASHWPWDHIISSRPLIGQPPQMFLFLFLMQNAYLIVSGASICIGWEIRCLPYAGFFFIVYFIAKVWKKQETRRKEKQCCMSAYEYPITLYTQSFFFPPFSLSGHSCGKYIQQKCFMNKGQTIYPVVFFHLLLPPSWKALWTSYYQTARGYPKLQYLPKELRLFVLFKDIQKYSTTKN